MISIVASLLTIFGSIYIMRLSAKVWQLSFLGSVPYFVFYLKKKIAFKKKEGKYFVVGIFVLLVCSVNDIVVSLGWINTPRISSYSLFILVIGIVALLTKNFIDALRRSEETLAQATRLNLELIKKNIQPHFLMNSINASIFLVEENPQKAIELLYGLSDELRDTIRLSKETISSLENEIELCQNHLNIMSLRKEKKFELKVDGNLKSIFLPPLVLLTLVENGITHGYKTKKEGKFYLNIQRGKKYIKLHLFNDSEKNTESRAGTGTGLKYIEIRMREVFKENWSFEYGRVENGFEAKIKFPLIAKN